MTLHIVRARINVPALQRWAAERNLGWGRRRRIEIYDEGAALHHLLAESFGKAAIQPFRLLVPPKGRAGNLYGYSRVGLESLRATADAAMLPELAAVIDPDAIVSRPFPQDWVAGRRLGFDLRVRPVVRLLRPIPDMSHRTGAELDSFFVEALRNHPADPEGMRQSGRSREDVYAAWLAQRLGRGARVLEARLVRFERRPILRNGQIVDGPDAVLQGDLEIVEREEFRKVLDHGVGRHRAYGYGMLLLRPAGTKAPTC